MKRKLMAILALFNFIIIYSQNGNLPDFGSFERYTQTNFSTPEVKAFEKVSLIPNDLSTGKLGLKIPIYTIKAGRILYPISLSYNSGGIKVDQQASEVGLGWSLSKTVISRQIIDGNDFDNVGTQWLDPVGGGFGNSLSDPEYSAHFDIFSYPNESRMGYFLKKARNQKANVGFKSLDEMPDLYSLISSDGFSTKFYFRDKQTPIELVEGSSLIRSTEVKKTFNNPAHDLNSNYPMHFPMYDFEKIEVTSKDGIKYTFEDYDVSLTNSYSNPVSNVYVRIGVLNVPMVTSWHISKIEDMLTGDKIEFEYDTYNADPVTGPFGLGGLPNPPPDALLVSESIKTFPFPSWINSFFNNCPARFQIVTGQYNTKKHYYKRWSYTRYYVKNRLKNIKFSGGRIEFNWTSDRLDAYNTKTLSNVEIYGKEDYSTIPNKLINKFDFTFDYFNSGCSNPYKCKRLRLKNIKEMGKPSYSFSYFNENDYFPEITSNKKDFLGYYNSAITQPQNAVIVPNLYYYPNKKEYSILPFNISGETKYPIHGNYNDNPSLSDVKRWSLKSIQYPTGATTDIEYELNKIKVFNQNVTASGLRLKSSTIKDENNIVRKIQYRYENPDGSSSGTLVNPPDYGRPTIIFDSAIGTQSNLDQWESNSLYDTFIVNQYPKIDADLTNGNYVMYSHVKEEEVGNGYTTYSFISNDTEPNEYKRTDPTQEPLNLFTGGDLCESSFTIRNSAYGLNFYSDNSYKRGKLLSKKVFDNSSNIKQELINTYAENKSFITESFKKRFFRATKRYVNDANDDFENMMDMTKEYKQNTFKLIKSIQLDYLQGKAVKVSQDFEYNSLGLMSLSKKSTGLNENIINEYTYVFDSNVSNTGISHLQSINFLSDLVIKNIKHESSGVSENVESFKKEYNANGFPAKILTSYKGNSFVKEFDFDLYNTRGKLKQFRDKSGKYISLFWSNDLLIAKVKNATYSSIKNYIQTTNQFNVENCGTKNCSQYFSETLRGAFPNAHIYSYTYDTTLGNALSVTDPKNEVFYYEYDSYNRLIHIKDKNGNILSKNDYNYKLPN